MLLEYPPEGFLLKSKYVVTLLSSIDFSNEIVGNSFHL
jgi:hypothetical protein